MIGFWEDIGNRLSLNVIKKLESKKVICLNCGNPETLQIKLNKYTTFKCSCGTKIIYPAHIERDYSVTTFISRLENNINTHIDNNNIEIKNKKQYFKLYKKIRESLNIKPESDRFFERFKRRKAFKREIFYGIGRKKEI